MMADGRQGSIGWALTTLVVGATGGACADRLSIPLGWLLGSMIFTAALCCTFEQARLPQPLRYAGQLVIGVSAGLAFTPELAMHVVAFTPVILLTVFASVALGICLSGLLTWSGRVSRTTAYFASLPGGVAEMANLADRNGGDVGVVAVAQTLRIFLAVLTVPPLARVLGREEHVRPITQGPALAWGYLLALSALALAVSTVLTRRRVPNAWLIGGISVGTTAALVWGVRYHLPWQTLSGAQVLIGTSLGARLRRHALAAQRALLPLTIGSTLILLIGCLLLGKLLSVLTGAGLTSSLLSTSPGGLAEMSLTAVALGADVSLVTAFHLVRTLTVALLSVPLFSLILRWQERPSRDRAREQGH